MALPGVTAVPAAIKTLDINQDGQTDLLIFKDYGAPLLVLGQKDGPPRPFTGSLGPLSTRRPAGVSLMNLDGPAMIVAQNTLRAPRSRSTPTATGTSRISTTPAATRPRSSAPPRSTPTATAPRRSSCSTALAQVAAVPLAQGRRLPAQRHALGRHDQLHRHARRRPRRRRPRRPADRRHRPLRRAPDRTEGPAAQDDRHLRIQAQRGQARRPGRRRRQRRRRSRRRLHRHRRAVARDRHLRRRPRADLRDHVQDLRAQDVPQRRRRRSSPATWPSATSTATAGPTSS